MMIRQVRLVLIAAALVTLLALAAVVLHRNSTVSLDNGGPLPSDTVTFKAMEPVDVRHVLISNEHGTFEITFTGEGYRVDDIPAELVDMEEFLDLLTNCGMVYATQIVTPDPQSLARYGLSEPAAQVAITYSDESTLTLLIGDTERVTGDTYFSVTGNPAPLLSGAVYLMESERNAGFLLPKKAYVDDRITPELALSSPLSAILDVTFTDGQLADPVKIEAVASAADATKGDPEVVRAAVSFGAPTHIVRGKGTYELDQTYGGEMLGALLGITAHDIVGYQFTREEMLAFGFDHPTMQVTFDLKNGLDAEVEHYVLEVLQKDDVTYMTRNHNGVIYIVQEPAFLQIEYSKLLVRWFLSPLLMDVRAIEIATEGETYEFVITGETNAEKQVTCNGKDLGIERFRTLYSLLISAAHDGRLLEDITVEGAPLLRLTYYYLDEQKQPDVMVLYPGDTRRVYVQVNGVTELAMQETYLTRVQAALSILWADEPIETDW
jgi:hypothetical protein